MRIPPLSTYGHFTAMQVRGRAVRGLDHHLRRLDNANRELFGAPLCPDEVRAAIHGALAGDADASVRVYVVDGVLSVSVGPPVDPPQRPQRLRSVAYLRPFAHLKHLGGFAQTHHGRLAEGAGYDDALLTGPDGTVSESTIANIGFIDANGEIVWPQPPWLHGTTMQLVEAGTPTVRRRITLDDVAGYEAAFLANSHGVVAVAGIDEVGYAVDETRIKRVRDAYESAPLDPL